MPTKDKTINGLLIDDDSEDTMLLMELMARSDWPTFKFAFTCAETLEAGLKLLREGDFEVVLLDLMLPDSQGLETVRKARSQSPDVPIVVLTGLSDERMGLEAVAQGAQDYQVKGELDGHALKRTISFAVERHRLAMELRRLEQLKAEVLESRKMDKLKDELLSAISHEMRSPLTIIKASVANMEEGLTGPPTAPQAQMLGLALRNIARLERVVDNILDLSRLESGRAVVNAQPIDVHKLMSETADGFDLVAQERGIVIERDIPRDIPRVVADPELFIEVLENLLSNALRFTREKIVLRARAVELSEDEAPLMPRRASDGTAVIAARKCVQLSVIDDGKGIPKDRVCELFNKFAQIERRKQAGGYGGVGLGLALCKEILDRQQGKIWVESDEGRGASFHFALPRA